MMEQMGPLELIPSKTVHSILRKKISPWAKANDFRRANRISSWTRPQRSKHLTFWIQLWDYFDRFAGGQFVVEFQLAPRSEFGAGRGGQRKRLWRLLDEQERWEAMSVQNEVIRTLPPAHKALSDLLGGETRRSYLAEFELLEKPPGYNEDIWLRYTKVEHVEIWGEFIVSHLPSLIERFLKSAEATNATEYRIRERIPYDFQERT